LRGTRRKLPRHCGERRLEVKAVEIEGEGMTGKLAVK